MIVTTPDKLLLRIIWDAIRANGLAQQVRLIELARRIEEIQRAGMNVYAADDAKEIEEALAGDARMLESLGLLRLSGEGSAELTRAGEMLASKMEYPHWAQSSLETQRRAEASPA